MSAQQEARSFLNKLLQAPPALPFEPMLLPRLFAVTRDEATASIEDIVSLIEHSQKLTARILAIANSAAYGLRYKVSTLRRAVSILGFREVRLLATLVATASVIKEAGLPKNFNINALWCHQLETAFIAKTLVTELSDSSNVKNNRLGITPDEAYVAGLLHDIGKVFFAASRPDIWQKVESMRMKALHSFSEAENAYWGIDHALIGAEVLHTWNLPLLLSEPINWHHAPELAPLHVMETRLLAAANHIAHDGLDKEGQLNDKALALLPAGCSATALGRAIAQNFADPSAKCLMTLVR